MKYEKAGTNINICNCYDVLIEHKVRRSCATGQKFKRDKGYSTNYTRTKTPDDEFVDYIYDGGGGDDD